MKHINSLLAVAALIILASPDVVSAFQSKSAGPLNEEFKKATAVFTGTLVNITKPSPDKYVERNGQVIYEDKAYVYVTFEVKKSWKGVRKGESVITVKVEGARFSCGIKFRKDVVYLIYARGSAGKGNKRLWIDPCTGSGRIEEEGRYPQKLNVVKLRRGVKKRG